MDYIGLKKINGNIRSIKDKGAKLSALIHNTAVQCLLHATQEVNGKMNLDARPTDQLLQALPNGMRKEGFKIWVQKYSPITWTSDGMVRVIPEKSKAYKPFNIEGANAEPFWDASVENRPKELTAEQLIGLINNFVKKVNSADDNGEVTREDGTVAYHLQGNVVGMKEWAKKVQESIANVPAPPKDEAKHESTTTLIPGASSVPGAVRAAMTEVKEPVALTEVPREERAAA